jgi:hypothetical protein
LAKKYELFTAYTNPEKILPLEMTYGNLTSFETQNEEDDLSALMQEFVDEHQNGYMLLSVSRCVDEYYYFEYTDADGGVMGVARIHYQRLSNRRIKKGQVVTGAFRNLVMVQK